MSKYKYEMWVSAGYFGSGRTKKVDLVDDWGYDESDLNQRTEEDIIIEIEGDALESFVWNSIDSGARRV
jgi:hypothetical protein